MPMSAAPILAEVSQLLHQNYQAFTVFYQIPPFIELVLHHKMFCIQQIELILAISADIQFEELPLVSFLLVCILKVATAIDHKSDSNRLCILGSYPYHSLLLA